jgi:hypothetical protein
VLISAVGGVPYGTNSFGTAAPTYTQPKKNLAGGIAGGAATGASIGAMFGGVGAPVGAVAGGILGAL